jgi:hypothetical protein
MVVDAVVVAVLSDKCRTTDTVRLIDCGTASILLLEEGGVGGAAANGSTTDATDDDDVVVILDDTLDERLT